MKDKLIKLGNFFKNFEISTNGMTGKQSWQYWLGVTFIMILMMPLAGVMVTAGVWYYATYIILYIVFIWIVFGELRESILRDS